MSPEGRERQRLTTDLYIVTGWLKRGPISIGEIKDFRAWKQDLLEA